MCVHKFCLVLETLLQSVHWKKFGEMERTLLRITSSKSSRFSTITRPIKNFFINILFGGQIQLQVGMFSFHMLPECFFAWTVITTL